MRSFGALIKIERKNRIRYLQWENKNSNCKLKEKEVCSTRNRNGPIHSKVLRSLNKPAASLIRENSKQNAWTSMKRSLTAIPQP